MNKLKAIIKREYVQRVRSRMFIVVTLLGPLMVVLFTVVPGMIFSIKTGGATRIAIVDQTGRLYDRIQSSLLEDEVEAPKPVQAADDAMSKNIDPSKRDRLEAMRAATGVVFQVEKSPVDDDISAIEGQLNERVAGGELDGYVVIPKDVLDRGEAEFYARNVSDVLTRDKLAERISRAVIEQRMIDANIAPDVVRKKNEPVRLKARKAGEGGQGDSGGAFIMVFVVGFLIYITILMYGQAILGAVVEEKETRIAEMLFSSVKSTTLMIGKLIGVSLVALTQFTIWGVALAVFALYGVGVLMSQGIDTPVPHMNPVWLVWFLLFFLHGYFLYATIYALVGSMVTTVQEGGQMSLPIVFTLVIGFYLAFPVIRSPDSPFAFWISMVPLFSPITMVVRIVTQTPPVWQILLSLFIGFATTGLMLWLAARIYRVGMLMYGKKATIPEVLRWVRQD